MNWEAIGAVGEVLGAAAVILTLFFLIVQLRQNTRALEENARLARDDAANRNYSDLARWRDLIIREPEVTDLWHRGTAGEELKADEAERFIQLLNEFFFGLCRWYESALATGNQPLQVELVRVAAAYARSEVIANHFKFFSANPTFAEFAEEVVGLTDSVGSEGTDTKELYDMLRSSSIKGPAGA